MTHYLYDSNWNGFTLDMKADLIPIIETINNKPIRNGANIELWKEEHRMRNFADFLKLKEGLDTWLENHQIPFYQSKENDYYISMDEYVLDELISKEISIGDFLGYPDCCSKAFYKQCQKYIDGKGKGPMVKFWIDADNEINNGSFNENLFYTIYAPCSVDCEESIDFCHKIRTVLEKTNMEVANYLRQRSKKYILQFSKSKRLCPE